MEETCVTLIDGFLDLHVRNSRILFFNKVISVTKTNHKSSPNSRHKHEKIM